MTRLAVTVLRVATRLVRAVAAVAIAMSLLPVALVAATGLAIAWYIGERRDVP